VPETTTTTAEVLPTSVVNTTTTEAPTTTAGAQPEATVLGEQVTRDQTLPRTGSNTDGLLAIGLAFLLAGLVFVAHGRVRMSPEL
jgi:LPXTG-motif cell wall-anchored protein